MLFIGMGFALASPAALTVSLKFVDRENQGSASGVFYMASAVSGLLGVTFASAAFQYWPGTVSLSYMGMFAVSLFSSDKPDLRFSMYAIDTSEPTVINCSGVKP